MGRWRTVYHGKWQATEHTNVQELRALVGLARHLARPRRRWGEKCLVFVDSMVALGAASKGRSSSRPLLRLCRQLAAVTLSTGLRMLLRYIPSEWNPADASSRFFEKRGDG